MKKEGLLLQGQLCWAVGEIAMVNFGLIAELPFSIGSAWKSGVAYHTHSHCFCYNPCLTVYKVAEKNIHLKNCHEIMMENLDMSRIVAPTYLFTDEQNQIWVIVNQAFKLKSF